jgi:predicted nucleic acid-binding protein
MTPTIIIDCSIASYDAGYLELALRRHLPLASLDDDLRQAAIALGIPVLGK